MLSPMPVPTPRCHFSFVMATCTSPRPFSECATGSSSTLVQTSKYFVTATSLQNTAVWGVENFQRLTLFARHILSFSRQIVVLFCFSFNFSQNIQTAAHTYLNNFESPSIPANSLGRHSGKKGGRRIGADTAHTEVETPRPYVARRTDSPSVLSPHRTSAPAAFRDPARPREVRTDPRALSSLDTAVLEVRPESSPRAPDRRADPRASSLPIQAKRATVWVTRDDRPDQPRRRCARTPNPPPRAPEPRPHPPAASPRLS